MARKYVSTTDPGFPAVSGVSNVSSMAVSSQGLNLSGRALVLLAERAAAELVSTRQTIVNLDPWSSSTPAAPVVNFTDTDVNVEQDRFISVTSAGTDADTADAVKSLVINSSGQMLSVRDSPQVTENSMIPTVDQIELKLMKGKGISDSFFSSLTFSLKASDYESDDIAAIMIYRAYDVSPAFSSHPPELSIRGMSVLSSLPPASRAKNENSLPMLERQYYDSGVRNDLTSLSPTDRFTGERVAATGLNVSSSVDPSVLNNPQFLDSWRIQDPSSNLYIFDDTLLVGSSSPTNTLGQAHADDLVERGSGMNFVVVSNNSQDFKRIFLAGPNALNATKVGDRYYFQFDDNSVVFGRMYAYFIVTVNKDMVTSNRSSIAKISIDGVRVPARPKHVLANIDNSVLTLFSTVDDQFVEKFEIWKKYLTPSEAQSEFSVITSDNGFLFVDEVNNAEHRGGANWIDRKVIPGHSYLYRVYSVDIFGNKSESPYELRIDVPDATGEDRSLPRPSILSEVDSKTQKIKIVMRCDDPRIKKLRLERRDLTIGQEAFTVPGESGRIIMGLGANKHGSYSLGEHVASFENAWNGWFDNQTGGVEFLDRLTTFDRTYQYRVHGVDVNGNKTSYDYSAPTMVFRKPMINVPVNFSSSFVTGTSGEILGLYLSWQSSSIDVSSEDKLGSQTALADTAIRTLYQLERRKENDRWLSFNMTENTTYFDPVVGYSGTLAPEFRPPFLEPNLSYEYRVQAVLSGGFISNRSPSLQVRIAGPVMTPENFVLRTTDIAARPFYIVLNWDTPGSSGVVDRWEIRRVEINNFAADRLNLNNQGELAKLRFDTFRTVYKESSRSQSYWKDVRAPGPSSGLLVGQHHFMDSQVMFGNTYIYRIVAIDPQGNRSLPAYRGMKLTSPFFERVLASVISSDERETLTNSLKPLRLSPACAWLTCPTQGALNLVEGFGTPNNGQLVSANTFVYREGI